MFWNDYNGTIVQRLPSQQKGQKNNNKEEGVIM